MADLYRVNLALVGTSFLSLNITPIFAEATTVVSRFVKMRKFKMLYFQNETTGATGRELSVKIYFSGTLNLL